MSMSSPRDSALSSLADGVGSGAGARGAGTCVDLPAGRRSDGGRGCHRTYNGINNGCAPGPTRRLYCALYHCIAHHGAYSLWL
eukprot:1164254-Pyramimonas_sp.AAC.1